MPTAGLVDLHAHLLPGVDDGPGSLEEALATLRMAHAGGTRRLAATPHLCSPLFPAVDVASVRAAYERLQKGLAEAARRPENAFLRETRVDLGAENHLSPELLESARVGEALTLNGGRYLLVELPFYSSREVARMATTALLEAGYLPVLAHVERYPFFLESPAALEPFLAAGCIAQLNGSSVLPGAERRRRRAVRKLLRSGAIQVIASDGHGPGRRHPDLAPVFRELVKRFSREQAERWLYENPLAVLENRDLAP